MKNCFLSLRLIDELLNAVACWRSVERAAINIADPKLVPIWKERNELY